jgi:hypothetical protein
VVARCSGRPDARKTAHRSRGGGASIGPSALDRRTGSIRGSAWSHRIVRSQPNEPRWQHCRPEPQSDTRRHALAACCRRLPSRGGSRRRACLMREAPEHSRWARHAARGGVLSRASALRPCALLFETGAADGRLVALHGREHASCAVLATQRRRWLSLQPPEGW